MTLREIFTERYAPLHDLSDRTIEVYGHTLDRFAEFLEHEPELADLDDLVVSRFLRWRAKTARKGGKLPSANSVLKDRTQLSALWSFCAKKRMTAAEGKMVEFPALARMRAVERIPRAYSHSDVEKIVRRAKRRYGSVGGLPAPWWWMTICMTAWTTAERLGALMALRWGEVDLDRRMITFLGANRKGRTRDIQRAITPQLADMLRTHRRGENDLVWPWDRRIGSIWCSLKMLCKQSNVTYRGFHGFRKASASYFEAAGGSATALLDHDRPATTKRSYLDPDIVRGGPSAADLLPPLDLNDQEPEAPAA
jgi:integrase